MDEDEKIIEELKKNRRYATPEEIFDNVEKLKIVFYETPDSFWDALQKILISLNLSYSRFVNIVREAIFTVKKTKITVADIIKDDELWR